LSNFINLTNQRFSRLVVKERINRGRKEIEWLCLCDCGNTAIVLDSNLRTGQTTSCGCVVKQGKELTGLKFERLVVLKRHHQNKESDWFWECLCDCGNKVITKGTTLTQGKVKSCGCYHKDKITTHSMWKTPLYKIYRGIKSRCLQPLATGYSNYGGRGITVCDEWKMDPASFFKWAKENRYEEGLTIERIDNNGPYSPENCKWIPLKEQANNKRTSHIITFNGETKTVAQWATYLNIPRYILYNRINNYGWTDERALTTPVGERKKGERKSYG
jgi:hypothetical protein